MLHAYPVSRLLRLVVTVACVGWITVALAQGFGQGQVQKRQVMAAFLAKFGAFIEWPQGVFADENQPLVIDVVGADDIVDYLRRISYDEVVHGRPVNVRRLYAAEPIRGQILYVDPAMGRRADVVLGRAQGAPVLTVTARQRPGLAATGIINFVWEDDRLRFDIDLLAAKRADLKVSAKLLGVARKVHKGTH